jgi:hypothetical protein
VCSAHWEIRNACQILVGKPEGKRPLARPRNRWEDIIKVNLGKYGVDWIHLAQIRDRLRVLVNTIMNCRVSCKAENSELAQRLYTN